MRRGSREIQAEEGQSEGALALTDTPRGLLETSNRANDVLNGHATGVERYKQQSDDCMYRCATEVDIYRKQSDVPMRHGGQHIQAMLVQ